MIEKRNINMQPINKIMRLLHIFSAMPVLILMFFFAITGFILNHPDWEGSGVETVQMEIEIPEKIAELKNWEEAYTFNSLYVLQWLDKSHELRGVDFEIEWENEDRLLIINLDSPSVNSVVELSLEENLAIVESRKLTALASLNNIHRGKHVSGLWIYVSDISAICMLLFCISGLWLIVVNKLQRSPAMISLAIGSGLFFISLILMH